MNLESAVQFATNSRIHIGIAVRDLSRSVAFYRTLLNQEPSKTRPHYAKFEVAEPPLNLSLNEFGGHTGPNNPVAHFGIQLKSIAEVKAIGERLEKAGFVTSVEEKVTCCYAVQSKVWVSDPDGNKWEVYVLLDDDVSTYAASQSQCCVPNALTGLDSTSAHRNVQQSTPACCSQTAVLSGETSDG